VGIPIRGVSPDAKPPEQTCLRCEKKIPRNPSFRLCDECRKWAGYGQGQYTASIGDGRKFRGPTGD